MPTFLEARLGDVYNIALDQSNQITDPKPSSKIITATVIGIAKDPVRYDGKTVLLGWRKNETIPLDAVIRNMRQSQHINFVENQHEFIYSKMLMHTQQCLGKYVQQITSNGCICSKCREIYPYASANQADGSFICYGCRMEW